MSNSISASWILARFIKLTCWRFGLLNNARSLFNLISDPAFPKGIIFHKADVKLPVASPSMKDRSLSSQSSKSFSLKSLKILWENLLVVIPQRKRRSPTLCKHRPTRASLSTEKVINPQGEFVDIDPNSVSPFCKSNRHSEPVEWETARRFLSGEHWK